MSSGYLALVLHAHLPYVRHPEQHKALEERWLFEALTETYIPLLRKMTIWTELRMDWKLTLSISTTLLLMLQDEYLMSQYSNHLEHLIDLAERELTRTRGTEFAQVAQFYHEELHAVQKLWTSTNGKLIELFANFKRSGNLEIITTAAATHAFLPLVLTEEAVKAQVSLAMETFKEAFEAYPIGVWLPECAYRPRLEHHLREFGVRYFLVDTHGISNSNETPVFGVYSPCVTDSHVAVFSRDDESAKQVWSSLTGYPGDYDYREFYRDVGYELPLDYLADVLPAHGRADCGLKYYRITGATEWKDIYRRELALEKAAQHADDFLGRLQERLKHVKGNMGRTPLVTSMYDAELFGHWWFEGPEFLDFLFRKIHFDQNAIRLTTPANYLNLYQDFQKTTLEFTSWGRDGYADVWLNGRNDWIYKALHRMERDAIELANAHPLAQGLIERALNQAMRELVLAQSSDFAFMMDNQTTVEYAVRRTKFHVNAFFELRNMIRAKSVDEGWLQYLESRDNVFQNLDYRLYRTEHKRVVAPAHRRPTVLMFAWEYPPTVVGGLSRHVGSLAPALVRQGFDVHVVTCEALGTPYEEVVDGVHVHRCYILRPHAEQFLDWVLQLNLAMSQTVRRLVGDGVQFDVIHAHDWLVMTSALMARKELQLPLVSTIHATEHGRNQGIHSPLQHRIHRQDQLLIESSDAVIVCSQYMERELKDVFGVRDESLNVIPNGVELQELQRTEPTGLVHSSEPIILFVGRMVREKGVQTLIEAAPHILHLHPNAQFVALGKGPLLEEFRNQASSLPFIFPGFVDDDTRNAYFRRAAVCVFPSLYEPFGIVALEAMAMRTPVVVSDVGGLREVVHHGTSGLTFYAGNAVSLADQVNRLLLDSELRERIVRQAYRQIETKYHWDAIAKHTSMVYSNVLTMHPRKKEEIVG